MQTECHWQSMERTPEEQAFLNAAAAMKREMVRAFAIPSPVVSPCVVEGTIVAPITDVSRIIANREVKP